MKKHWALLLGIVTIGPPVYMAIMFVSMIWEAIVHALFDPEVVRHGIGFVPFEVAFLGHAITMILIVVLLFVYIPHLFRTDRVRQDTKALWAVVLFLGNIFAMPVYWYFYIWRRETTARKSS